MSAQHTPGPWQAYRIEKKGPGLPYTPVAAKTLLAKVYSEAFGDYEQSEANARLIAAAPDLLNALQYIVGCSAPMTRQQEECWPVMRAAIAKATGQKGGA